MSKLNKIDAAIRDYYQKKNIPVSSDLITAILYSVDSGGKRIRPLIFLDLLEGFGLELTPSHFDVAASLEMIHTGSLIHDDLPAMDDDELRRGRKTTHVVYGEDMGILAGDALLNYAFETAAAAFDEYPEKALQIGKAMKILGNKAGIYGMLGGQVVDVKETGHAVDKDVLDFIYALKTGALLESSMMIGATLAGADDESIALIEKVASKVGLAFQVQDDILDVTSTAEVLGKPIHSDEKNEKTTYVTLLGIDKAEKIVEKESVEAIELLKSLPVRNDYLEWLLTQLIHRKK